MSKDPKSGERSELLSRLSGWNIAAHVEALIAKGHPPKDVWSYTPLQMESWLFIADKRLNGERGTRKRLSKLPNFMEE